MPGDENARRIDSGRESDERGADNGSGRPGAEILSAAQPANDLADLVLGRLVIDDSDPFFIASLDGFILHTSPLYDELSARSEGALPPGPGGGSSEVTSAMRSAIAEAEVLGRSVRYDESVVLDGDERYLTVKYIPVQDENGRALAAVVSFRDTTAQVKQLEMVSTAQQRFRDFARATSDWYWEVDRNLAIRSISDRFTALTGIPTASLIGRRLEALGASRPNHRGFDGLQNAIRRRVSFRDQLLEIESGGGAVLRFHLSGVPVFDRESGGFDGYRGAGTDVTQHYRQIEKTRRIHKDLERTLSELTDKNTQLDVASAQAESALRAKNEFLASMSHELRTPLNAIIGFAEAMKMKVFGNLDDRYIEYSGDIMSAGRHLLDLIDDVLDVAVMESGELSLSIEPVSLRGIVDKARSLSVYRAQGKNLDLSWLRMEGDLKILADERRATQIFVNLMVNAMKFTMDSGRVGLETESTPDGRVRVTIWDNGIGIPKDKQQIIFEKFRQVNDNVYQRSVEGSGLGLHISRELARRMDGDLTVESKPGEGSRFTVTLPLAERDD